MAVTGGGGDEAELVTDGGQTIGDANADASSADDA